MVLCGGDLALPTSNLVRSTGQEIRSSIYTAVVKGISEVLTNELDFPRVPHVCLTQMWMVIS